MTADATTCGSGQECLGMLRNKVSPNDESVHSQSKDERKQEAARSPEPVNQIDILTYHIIVFALCQIQSRVLTMTLTMKLVQLRAGARASVQGQLSDKDTEKLKVKVDPLYVPVWEFDTSFVATLFPPLIPAVVGLKRAACWTGRQWSSFYQITFFNAYCVLQENCRNMQQWHLASLLPPLPPMKWKLTLRSSGMMDIKVHWNIYIHIYFLSDPSLVI